MKQDLSAQLACSILCDIGIVGKDLDKTVQGLEALGIGSFILGGGPPPGAEGLFYRGKPLESDYKARLIRVGNLQMELIQPDNKPNPWAEFLKAKGEGIHHIVFQVAEVEQAVKRLTALGTEEPFFGEINGKVGAVFVDLKIAGLFFELTSFMT